MLRKVLAALAVILAVFLIVRAVVELFVIDLSDPSSYASDWGGPSLVGVLIVHCLPGVLAAFTLVLWWHRRRGGEPTTR